MSSPREVAIVLFNTRLLPTHSFAKCCSRQTWAALPGHRPRQMRIYLVRIPHRKGHSIQSVVRPGLVISRQTPHPRTDSSWPKREGSQVATRQLRSNNRAESYFLLSPLCFTAKIPLTWAEDRALLWEATPAPSQGPAPNGAARCRPLPFGIGTKALNPPGCAASLRVPPLIRLYTLLFILLLHSRLREDPALGLVPTQRRSCLTAARDE